MIETGSDSLSEFDKGPVVRRDSKIPPLAAKGDRDAWEKIHRPPIPESGLAAWIRKMQKDREPSAPDLFGYEGAQPENARINPGKQDPFPRKGSRSELSQNPSQVHTEEEKPVKKTPLSSQPGYLGGGGPLKKAPFPRTVEEFRKAQEKDLDGNAARAAAAHLSSPNTQGYSGGLQADTQNAASARRPSPRSATGLARR
ncbi:hypothetical protein ACIPPJ_33470 [Streptomyces sp. NPDC086091]|uniref:hypothetical protein n=1 Tax=Streptomyces sp. NPDC086091 TaxID=3365751 RepID=UPI0037FC6210